MVVSVSSDGHYAIVTNTNKQAILWNLQNHTYNIVFKDANIYSAYFIKNTDDFMYQNDANNEVIIESINDKVIKKFNPGLPTYGEVMTTDLQHYFAVDGQDQLFEITPSNEKHQMFWHYCDDNDPPIPNGVPYTCGSFFGDGKLFNLTLSTNDQYLVTSGFEEFYVWQVDNRKLLMHSFQNDAQTVSATNPDSQYTMTGDIMNRGIKYTMDTQHSSPLFLYHLPFTQQQEQNFGAGANEILAIKFIANNELLVFRNGSPELFNYAALYNTSSLKYVPPYQPGWIDHELIPVKYLPLIPNAATDFNYQKTWPLTGDNFARDQAIDTSPSAHILVMSMVRANGIIVYHYDPKTQTLTREWADVVNSWWHL